MPYGPARSRVVASRQRRTEPADRCGRTVRAFGWTGALALGPCWLALAACAPPAPPADPVRSSRPFVAATVDLPSVGDDDQAPIYTAKLWVGVDGYTLLDARAVEDLDGDHQRDALVTAEGPLGTTLFLVPGPLRTRLVLPGAEVAEIRGARWDGVHGDATGDGVPDLLVAWGESQRLVPGPVVGRIDPAGLPAVDGTLDDVDGDDVLDRIHADRDEVDIHFGPADRYDGPADRVVAQWTCASRPGWAEPPDVLPDIDGDGVPELRLGAVDAVDCPQWVVSVPEAGWLDPATAPGTLRVRGDLQVVRDQTGDGVDDVVRYELCPAELVAGPVAADHGDLVSVGGPEIPLPPSALGRLVSAASDLDGDDRDDFLATRSQFPAPADTVVVRGGAEQLAVLALGTSYTEPLGDPFVEDGVPAMLVSEDGAVLVIDLVYAFLL